MTLRSGDGAIAFKLHLLKTVVVDFKVCLGWCYLANRICWNVFKFVPPEQELLAVPLVLTQAPMHDESTGAFITKVYSKPASILFSHHSTGLVFKMQQACLDDLLNSWH